jgi:3-methyladenine DNA glycosylase AlkD
MSAGKAVIQIFDRYQKERVLFVQSVADLATRPQNVEALMNAGVMALLRPLLLDNVPSIQQSAALALGRLANYNDDLAEAVVSNDILPQLVYQLSEQNRFYKKAAAFVLRAVAKHSPQLAKAVVDSGALDALVGCLEEFDPGVKEAAAWALGYIARHNFELAQTVVDAGAVPLLVLCVQEPELTQKRIAASALSDICKHAPELAQAVVDAGAVAYLAPLVTSHDSKLKRQVCSALGQTAKHSVDLAEVVVEAEIFPTILQCLKDVDIFVRKNAATVIREIVKHTPELAQLVVSSGGVGALVDYVNEAKGNNRLPGVMTFGSISAFSETLALAVIVAKGIPPLVNCLVHEPEDHIKAASAWSLGQIGRHSPDHAKALADANVFPKLLAVYLHEESSDDLKTKAKRAMKSVIEKCVHLPALEPLLHTQTPPNILKYVVHQFAKVLPHDVKARKEFVSSGAIQRLQDVEAQPGSKLKEYVDTINSCYPEEIVRYYSPGYSEALMEKIDNYQLPSGGA